MIYSDLAQEAIDRLISTARAGELNHGLSEALKLMVTGLAIDRGLILQILGDRLTVTHEFSTNDDVPKLLGKSLDARTSTTVILQFLARYPDSSGSGIIVLTEDESDCWKPFLDLSKPQCGNLFVQLRVGFFIGFIALQHAKPKHWSTEEKATVESVASVISVLMGNQADVQRCAADAAQLNGLVNLLHLFMDKNGSNVEIVLNALAIVADILRFTRAQLYLHSSGTLTARGSVQWSGIGPLVSQATREEMLELSATDNSVVQVFNSGRGMLVDPIVTASSTHEDFENHQGIILPLVAVEGEPLGVITLWHRLSEEQPITPQDRELALWISQELSKCIATTGMRFESSD